MDEMMKAITDLETRIAQFRTAVDAGTAEQAVGQSMADFDVRFEGIVAPDTLAAMRHEHEHGTRAAYDSARLSERDAILKDHEQLLLGIATVATAMRQLAREPKPDVDAMRELAALQRFQGRTHGDVLKAYTETPDGANPTLIGLIERDRGAFRLTPDPDDVHTVPALAKAIEARQLARIPENIRQLEQRARDLMHQTKVVKDAQGNDKVQRTNVRDILTHFRGVAVASKGRMTLHAV